MGTLLKFEFKRFIKSRVNWFFMAVLIAGIILLFGLQLKDEASYMTKISERYDLNQKYSQSLSVSYSTFIKKEISMNGLSPEQMIANRDYYNEQAKDEQAMMVFYKNNYEKDYEYLNFVSNKLYNRVLQGMKAGVESKEEYERRGYVENDIQLKADYTKYLMDAKIKPMINDYKVNGANGMKLFFSSKYVIFILVMILFMIIEVYVREILEGSFKMYQTMPWRRGKLFLARGIFVVMLSFVLLLAGAGIYFLLCTLKGGIGDFAYPIMTRQSLLHWTSDGTAASLLLLPTWKYIVMGFVMVMAVILFSIAVVNWIALLVDSQSKTIGVMVTLILAAFVFASFLPKTVLVNFWYPYSYVFVDKVLLVLSRSNFIMGILVNLIGFAIVSGMSYVTYLRKDFVGARE